MDRPEGKTILIREDARGHGAAEAQLSYATIGGGSIVSVPSAAGLRPPGKISRLADLDQPGFRSVRPC